MSEPSAAAVARATARARVREVVRPSATVEENLAALVDVLVPEIAMSAALSLTDADGALQIVARSPATSDDAGAAGFSDVQRRVHEEGEPVVVDAPDGRRCLVVPVYDLREPLGTLAMVCSLSDDEVPDALGLLEQFAALSGVLVGRDASRRRSREAARHTQRVASQLHQLLAASIAIGALQDEAEILSSVARRIRTVFDADLAVVGVSGARDGACLVASGEGPPEAMTTSQAVDALGLPGDALTANVSRIEGSWLIAPILVRRGETQGSLAVKRERIGFEDDDVEVATLLAQTAASALASARLHRSVATSEERLRVLVDAAPVAIVETDHDGVLEWWNHAAQQLFGWGSDHDGTELMVLPATAAPPFHEAWRDTLDGTIVVGREAVAIELAGRRRDLTISVAQLPATEEREGSLLTVVEDVTDQRQLMEELRHAQRMEVIGQLASSIAHDFNNLLTLISGYAELLMGELPDEGHSRQLVADIQTSTQRASTLTGKLLTMGRTKSPTPVTFSPVESIRSLGEVLARIVGADVTLELDLDDAAGNVRADSDQFEQTIMNLATNARDAMPDGGRLVLSVVPFVANGVDQVRISVADTGSGMDAATLERCFEPLFTTKGPTSGTGLGLPAARRVVTAAGGSIECESDLGRGTTFLITMPTSDDPVERHAEPDPPRRASGGATVLLAEDEDGIRQLVSQVLTRSGYTVFEAENGERALELTEEMDGEVELLVSDVVMGGMTGQELAVELQARWPTLRVVLVSGNIDESAIEPLRNGSAAFLAKPFRPSELLEVITDLLAADETAAVGPT